MRLHVVNWQDRENPQAGGAEQHLHEIFGRLARRGHEVTLLDGIDVHRVGTRFTFPFLARAYYRRQLASRNADVLIEDVNKVPLYTTAWGARRNLVVVPHLFGTTVFQEAPFPLASGSP